MKQMPWIDRRFDFTRPVALFPGIVERLRGTPARVEERVAGLSNDSLTRRPGEKWSIQEHVGHLIDVEDLWLGRLDDYAAGLPELRPADMQNRSTFAADYNRKPIAEVLAGFRAARERLVCRLEALDDAAVGQAAHHPRLAVPMRIIDLALFAAEHDDHHLARITELMPASG